MTRILSNYGKTLEQRQVEALEKIVKLLERIVTDSELADKIKNE